MAFIAIDELVDDAVAVTRDADGKRVRIVYGSSSISLDVGEAVDLVGGLTTVLASLPPQEWEQGDRRTLARDEARVRAEAQTREEL